MPAGKRTKYIAYTDVGDDILDILTNASHVRINYEWYPVLGYDATDDTLCAEDHTDDEDWTIKNASHCVDWFDIKITVEVQQS